MTEERISPLRARMIEDMRIRGMGDKAQKAHIRALKDFAGFLGHSPDAATPEELRAYQLHMTDIAAINCILHIAQDMHQADLMRIRQILLPGVTVRYPDLRAMPGFRWAQDLRGHGFGAPWHNLVQHCPVGDQYSLSLVCYRPGGSGAGLAQRCVRKRKHSSGTAGSGLRYRMADGVCLLRGGIARRSGKTIRVHTG